MKQIQFFIVALTLLLFTGCNATIRASEDDNGRNTDIIIDSSTAINGAALYHISTNQDAYNDIEVFNHEPDTLRTATLTVVGDLMVHSWQLNDAYDKETDTYDFSNDFEMVQHYLKRGDFLVGNLETVFGGADIGYSDYPMFNTPDSFGYAIKDAGFDLLTTANNHSLDKRESGLLRTLDVLDELSIKHVGTYRNEEERDRIMICDVKGITMVFLSYTYGTNGIPIPQEKDYLINILEEDLILRDIQRARALDPDLIIVMPHMGNEYETYTRDLFKNQVDYMFDCGADIVLASHPHVLQPMEVKTVTNRYGEEREVFAIYSLGNFISSQRTEPRDYSMILNLEFSKFNDEKPVIEKVSFIPTWVQFKNQFGHDYVRVLPVVSALVDYEKGIENHLRPKDVQRLQKVHEEILDFYLGQSNLALEGQEEYIFYEKGEKASLPEEMLQ